ncbi:hypothetical protein [uncultured Helicobacter sp.]|uniref:hypothetical protein n=1 Tax=uncultured Helicobacter sp. TaxID=175537 RepID=UPI003752A7D7
MSAVARLRALPPKVASSSRLAQHSNLTQDTRISGKPSAESKANSESSADLDSRFNNSDLESKRLTESTTSKSLCEALPNINSVRGSASRSRI